MGAMKIWRRIGYKNLKQKLRLFSFSLFTLYKKKNAFASSKINQFS